MNALPQLRPMTFTDLIDASFRLYRSNFITFVGIVAVVQVPMVIAQIILQNTLGANYLRLLMSMSSTGGGSSVPFMGNDVLTSIIAYLVALLLLTFVQVLLLQTLCTGALARAISSSYLGQKIGIVDAYRFGMGRFLNLIGATVLVGLCNTLALAVVLGVPAGLVFAATQSGNDPSPAATIAALLLFLVLILVYVIAALVIAARLLFATQAIVLEDQGGISGLRRSWNLTQGSFWRIVGITALITLIVAIVAGIPAGVVSFLLNLFAAGNLDRMLLAQTINLVLTYTGNILALPLQYGIFTLLYYDLRVRKEAFDLELRTQQIEPNPETQPL
ncbi:MAG: hypothetical protein OHK0022_06320 [Roseiflexaceae bacterium]